MLTTSILQLTALGKRLRKSDPSLSADEKVLLSLVDGRNNIGRLIADRGDRFSGDFFSIAHGLEQRGLLQHEAPAVTARSAGEEAAQEQIWAEARRAARTLEEKGFFTLVTREVDPGREGQSEGLRVLVVEDDEDVAELLRALLEDKGFIVTHAADSPAALQELEQGAEPDLVLLDVVLPTSDGFEILTRIRRYTRLHDVPVVMVTSRISDEDVVRGLKGGADGYIFKPFQWDTLYACIQSVIGV